MASFGTVLNPEIAPRKVALRSVLTEYFGNPVMTKSPLSAPGISAYTAHARFNLGGGPRLLYVYTSGDANAHGTKFRLSELSWEALQTRALDDDDDAPPCDSFSYSPKNGHPYNTEVLEVSRNDTEVAYTSPLGYRVALLVKPGGSKYDYPPKGTLGAAIETYQTVIRLPN